MVNSLTTLTIAPIADVIKCMNGSATLTVNVATSSAEPYTYNWTPAVGTNTNTTYITSTPVTTTFVVTVNGVCANTATASVIVSNFPTNVNIIIPDSAAVCATTEFELNSVVTGGRAPYVYSWVMFPGLSVLSTSAVLSTAGPQADGTYSIMVTATDSCGFSDNDIQVITVLPACEIVIANIITPNGDGSNDFFKIKNIEYHPNSSLTIFDRWGKKVFSSGNYMNEWKAEGLNDGTYFYVLDVPEDKKYNGFVQVLR
jgi:gliding motility-associated-like protein